MKSKLSVFLLCLGLIACTGERGPRTRGVYMLLDTSGTYTEELGKAKQIISTILVRLRPGDSFAVASIDTGSFSEKDIKAKVTFDDRPSVTNKQKRIFSDAIGKYIGHARPSAFTDITGAVLQAVEYLNEKQSRRKTILIFSDLKEDLKKGYNRKVPLDLLGFDVVAVNVTKLRSDNIDPNEYIARLSDWKKRVEMSGGTWRVINDLDRLESVLPN